jgi:hypothetical protein
MSMQSRFIQFDEAIKLKRFEENSTLRDKRDIVLDKLRDHLRARGRPTFEPMNLGSYHMGTGVKPLDGDYDIDVGLRFNLSTAEYDPLTVKGWVHEALDQHTGNVRWRGPCVTVFYQRAGESIYHVDLAIFGKQPWHAPGEYALARGKQHSAPPHKCWEQADPQGLMDWVANRHSGEDGRQFRRCIRALKRWRDFKFPTEGKAAPVGIGLTVAAGRWFSVVRDGFFSDGAYNDLEALRRFSRAMLSQFQSRYENGRTYQDLVVKLPVAPNTDIFRDVSLENMTQFHARLTRLVSVLDQAVALAPRDEAAAARMIAGELGSAFPTG